MKLKNLLNRSKLNEVSGKRVTKQIWTKMTDDQKVDALGSATDDVEFAEDNFELKWNELPDEYTSNMYFLGEKVGIDEAKVNEAPMDKVFQKDWNKSAKAFITHIKHELKTAKGADKTVLKKMLQNLETVAGYPTLMGKVAGMQESKTMKLKDIIKENGLGQLPSSKLIKMKTNPLTERPINRGRVDYSTMELRSNIATKWLTTDHMIDDLTQWVQSVANASSTGLTREIGMKLKEMGINIIKGQNVDGEDRPAGAASKFD